EPQVVGAVLHSVAVVLEGLAELVEDRHREMTGRAFHAVLAGERGYLAVRFDVPAQGRVHPLPVRRPPIRRGQHVRMTSGSRTGVRLRDTRPGEGGGHERRASEDAARCACHHPLRRAYGLVLSSIVTTTLANLAFAPWPNRRSLIGTETFDAGASGCWNGNASSRLKSPWAMTTESILSRKSSPGPSDG